MSSEHIDHFQLWESALDGIDMPELPSDPLDEIVARAIDPIHCAIELNKYSFSNPEEARSSIMRRGISKLGYEFYGPYLGKQLTVTANEAFGIPETDEKLRKRDVHHASRYANRVIALGKMATFRTNHYFNETFNEVRTLITLCLTEPFLMNENGQIVTDHTLPDHMMFPITGVLEYEFGENS